MKKLLCLFLVFALFAFGCSKDSDETPDVPDGPDIQFYTLTISTTTGGSVDSEGGTYEQGEEITITATPEDGYIFQNWTGDENSSDNPLTIIMNDDIDIIANFAVNEVYSYNYNVPSHDWENYYTPWLSVYEILFEAGLEQTHWMAHVNTYYGIGDFNLDGYLDVNTSIPNNDDVLHHYDYFILDNGLGEYFLDEDFPYESDTEVYHSRKTIVGDFNLDNKPDVFRPAGAHDHLGYPNIVLSGQDGYSHSILNNTPLLQPHTVCSGDIDNDGDLDVFLAQSGDNDGFLINNGDATFQWKWISEVIEDFDSGYVYPDGGYGYYGIWSSEMTDVDNDGFVDLIVGGIYKDNDYDSLLDGPTIFWGDGSGKFYNSNSTTIFNEADVIGYAGSDITLSQDYAVNDVDGDGINDIAVYSTLDNEGYFYQIIKGLPNREFEDKTVDWLPNNVISGTSQSTNHVWVKLMDVDNNGLMDIVEGEPLIWIPDGIFRTSVRWEWNGNGFTKLN